LTVIDTYHPESQQRYTPVCPLVLSHLRFLFRALILPLPKLSFRRASQTNQ
jgi:hypothetical protein